MASSKAGRTAATVGAAALLLTAGGAIAYAATGDSTPSTASTASGSAPSAGSSAPSSGSSAPSSGSSAPSLLPPGSSQGGAGAPGQGGRGMGGSHTPVTGAELTKVTAAIEAKDSAVTVTTVVKDEDGSYDAFGTKDGQPVRVEASADLKTITVEAGMGRGGKGGGMGAHTPVTGAELTKVTAAITAKDSAVTVTSVVKDEDGSYDAFGTKDGQPVRVEASADLKTITVEAGMGRGGKGGGMGGSHTPVTGDELAKVTAAIKAKDSAVTVTTVVKDEDGSYDAFGTKDGQPVRVEASADLKTITVEAGMGRGGKGGHGMGGPGMGGSGTAPDGSGDSSGDQGGLIDPRLPDGTASPSTNTSTTAT